MFFLKSKVSNTYQCIQIYYPTASDKEKEKKTRQNSEIAIYLESLPREKRKRLSGEKKKEEKSNLVTPIEKNQEIRNQLVKRTKAHRKMLRCYNYKECSILDRANYKNYKN